MLREGICTCDEPGCVELPLLMEMPSSPTSMCESRSVTSAHESGSNPSVLGVNRGARMRRFSAITPVENVGWMFHAGELTKARRESVRLRLHATSKRRGPAPCIELLASPAAYQGQPPPSSTLDVSSAPSSATLVRLVPHSTAVGPWGQYSVGQRGCWKMGSDGLSALKSVAFGPNASVRLEASAIERRTRYVFFSLRSTVAPFGNAARHLSTVSWIAAVSSVRLSPTAPCASTAHAVVLPLSARQRSIQRVDE